MQSFSFRRRVPDVRVPVPPSVPTVLVMMAEAALRHGSNDWRIFWEHPPDPLSRIGACWPKNDEVAVQFLRGDLERAQVRGLEIDVQFLELGTQILQRLSAEQHRAVTALTDGRPFTVLASYGGKQVECVSDGMPLNFSLDFMGPATLLFRRDPVELLGIDLEM